MTAKPAQKKRVRKVSYKAIHKLANGVVLLAFMVILVAGLMAGVSMFLITFRAFVVWLVVVAVTRMVVSILAAYEEMSSGKA